MHVRQGVRRAPRGGGAGAAVRDFAERQVAAQRVASEVAARVREAAGAAEERAAREALARAEVEAQLAAERGAFVSV